MERFIITCILIGVLFLSEVAFAASPLTDIKIGDISLFSGEVLIRTQKKWMRLKKAPHPFYAMDKVVTRRGRAEVVFADGGRLKLDLDTNISIYQRQEESDKNVNPKVTLHQINILVGKVWFDVKIKKKGRSLKFKTPTMTAAIRGTEGGFTVSDDGYSEYGLISGDAMTTGEFGRLKETGPPGLQASLPPSDSQVDNNPLQQAAMAAVKATELADLAELAALTQKGDAENSDMKAKAQASVSATQAAYDRALSNHNTLLEMMLESQRFNISNESLSEQIQDSKAALGQLKGLVEQANIIAKDVAAAETEQNQQTGLAKLEEIEKQANGLASFTETAVNESFGNLIVGAFSPGANQDDKVEEVQASESDVPTEIRQDSLPESQNKEVIYEGDLETRIDPSPSQ